jgi:hypothetical protein
MFRALAVTLVAIVGACATNPGDPFQFEEDGGKADVVRPFGTFERSLKHNEYGFTRIQLNEDRTFTASQELVNCQPNECTGQSSGTFRFASSQGKTYIVLYNQGQWWYAFEYKLGADAKTLELRRTGTVSWFTMTRARDGIPTSVLVEMGSMQYADCDDLGTCRVVPAPCEVGRLCKFVVEISDPWEIMKVVLTLRGRGRWSILGGRLSLSPADFNRNELSERWSWTLANPGFGVAAPEICDTGPDLIEQGVLANQLAEGHSVCFWAFTVHRVTLPSGSEISSEPDGRSDCWEFTTEDCPADGCTVEYRSPIGDPFICQQPFADPDQCPDDTAVAFGCIGTLQSY